MINLKKVFLITVISCVLSVANISYRIFQDTKKNAENERQEESIKIIKDGKWDILLLRMDEIQSVGQVSDFLQKANIKRADRIVFGFTEKKDSDKKWDYSLLHPKEPNIDDAKLIQGEWWNESDGRPPLKIDFPPMP